MNIINFTCTKCGFSTRDAEDIIKHLNHTQKYPEENCPKDITKNAKNWETLIRALAVIEMTSTIMNVVNQIRNEQNETPNNKNDNSTKKSKTRLPTSNNAYRHKNKRTRK